MKKKRIGIITIKDDWNIGNRLQNLALQTFLERQNFQVKTIILRNNYKQLTHKSDFIRLIKNLYIYQLLRCCFKSKRNNALRTISFKKFNKNIKNYRKEIRVRTNFDLLDKEFDYFVCGSDQIWNPNLYNDDLKINTLTFTSENKKIAISPSIACKELTENQRNVLKKCLVDFKYLSCREDLGAEQIQEITNKKCVRLIDPTLMLSKLDYQKYFRKCQMPSQNFVLCYFLGDKDDTYYSFINVLKQEYNLDVKDVSPTADSNCGPGEFLYLISKASLIITDSYHGAIFSVIFEKPLRIFSRTDADSMKSRMDTFAGVFRCNKNIFVKSGMIINEPFSILYSKENLEIEKKRLTDFFVSCVNKNMEC
ncbi:MAG: polysaccharide pyruvyl transferase family protein [Candidatus Coproplasma sp.]